MTLSFHQISHYYEKPAPLNKQERRNAPEGKNQGASNWHLDTITLSADPGEIICLFGASGCGKTTLLRLAAGMEVLQEGRITLDGDTLSEPGLHTPPEKRPIGFVFQDYVLFPHLSVVENICFGLNHLPRKERRNQAQMRMEALRLEGLGNRYPNELSGGQQQRVALARALARNPKAMLLDEPFASLGMDLRRDLQEEMRQILKADKCAAIFVTHDPNEALLIGDRIALMDDGRIIETASPQSLYQNPQTLKGAMMHDGAQAIHGIIRDNHVDTAFGDCKIPAHLAPSQASNWAQGQSVDLVLDRNAITATDTHKSPLFIKECRFYGPDWILFVHHETSHETIRITSSSPLTIGQRVKTRLNPSQIKLITKRGNQ